MYGAAAFVDSGRQMRHKCYNVYLTVEMFTTRDGPAVIDAKAIKNRDLCLSHLHSTPPLGGPCPR